MSGEFDSRKDSQSTKFERRPRIIVKIDDVIVGELLKSIERKEEIDCKQSKLKQRFL